MRRGASIVPMPREGSPPAPPEEPAVEEGEGSWNPGTCRPPPDVSVWNARMATRFTASRSCSSFFEGIPASQHQDFS